MSTPGQPMGPAFEPRPIADGIAVAAQLVPATMADVARAGFRSVVNNRPDFEGGPAQPGSASLAEAAAAAGLAYRHLPVHTTVHTPQEARALASLLAELPRPVLLFCRSGARSARLFALATQG